MTTLLVPIALDVLVVRQAGAAGDWALTAMNVPHPPGAKRKRVQVAPTPFQSIAAPRPPGAYLHWAMPDALTHGSGGANGMLDLPALPDRWLVVRLTTPTGATQRQVDAWLLPDAGATQPVVLANALAGPALPAPETGTRGKLTAIGPGDLAWAAYYDNTVGRFALHDDLAGVTGAVAYLVLGWYTAPATDPIAAASESAFHDRLAALQWDLGAALPSGVPYPGACVFHGAAVSLGWPQANWPGDGGTLGSEADLRPDPAKLGWALGETMAEAVAAFAAPAGADADLQRLIEARIAGVLGDTTSADGLAKLETALQVTRFGSTPSQSTSEYIWEPASGSSTDGNFSKAERSAPRVWQAVDPAVVVVGGGRSGKHGGDGAHTADGRLACRIDSQAVTGFGVSNGDPGLGAAMLPATPLATLPAAYGVPAVAAALLVELACLDPGSAPDLSTATATAASPVAAARAAWWAAFDPSVPPATALQGSVVAGTLPSPVGVSPPMRPWTPLVLEWQADYVASPRGSHDWALADADFVASDPGATLAAAPGRPLAGRVLLAAGPSAMLAQAAGQAPESTTYDALGGGLGSLAAQLRGDSALAVVSSIDQDNHTPMDPGARPADFVALRAGFLRVDKARIVDAFGQTLALSGGTTNLVPRLGNGLTTPGQPTLAALKPRFTAPARVMLRFSDATGAAGDAGTAVTPVCGYVVPAPLDGTLEFFDGDGQSCGRLRGDPVRGSAWEEDPGQAPSLGKRPDALLANRFLGAFAQALMDAGAAPTANTPTALATLLDVLDTTRWTVDLTGNSGDEHLSLLLGQPVAVVRATIRLEVQDPRNPPENLATAVPVRLGNLAHLQDGLLAYFADDDFSRVRVVDPAIAALVAASGDGALSPYIDGSGEFDLYPGTDLALTLLMVPGTSVHVTTGLLPQKSIGLMREWTAPALTRLSPSLRFGPVLRDAEATRLPVPADIRGRWSWNRRPSPDAWASDTVVPSTSVALLPATPPEASDGWLQVALAPDTTYPDNQISHRITIVRRAHGRGKSRPVIAIGGTNANQSLYLLPINDAIRMIETGRFAFYVQEGGQPAVPLHVVAPRGAPKYLRTVRDSRSPNNLAKLPEAPPEV